MKEILSSKETDEIRLFVCFICPIQRIQHVNVYRYRHFKYLQKLYGRHLELSHCCFSWLQKRFRYKLVNFFVATLGNVKVFVINTRLGIDSPSAAHECTPVFIHVVPSLAFCVFLLLTIVCIIFFHCIVCSSPIYGLW